MNSLLDGKFFIQYCWSIIEMNNTTPELLDAFDASVRERLCAFMESKGATHSVGHSDFNGWPGPSSISKRAYQDLDGSFFWWINRFEVEDCTLDIGYGDKEFIVEPMLYYNGIKDHFAPWELLLAATVSKPHVASGAAWVLSADFMKKTIESTSEGIITHWQILSSPSPDLIDRARVMRGQRMIFAREEQRRRDRERASIQASTAFHNGDYSEAIRLLDPYRDDEDLPRSSAILLRLAKQKIG
jgi:hypothetical protein